ncbi:MAG: hypothetical protein Q8Q09_05465 [Deltaproteobacteria bacterium]|nr:hypothetical protein [Deltaproteobacteria bacterium]
MKRVEQRYVFPIIAAAISMSWGCSPQPIVDAGEEASVRNLRDGTVVLPSFYDASMDAMDAQVTDVPDANEGMDATDVSSRDDVTMGTDAQDAARESSLDASSDGSADAAADAMAAPATNLRFVHAVPPSAMGAPPSVDFCFRAAGGATFVGPILEAAGLTAGLGPTQVTRYFALPSGRHDVMVVGATAVDCSAPLLPLLPSVDFGPAAVFRTVVLQGIPGAMSDGGPSPVALRASVLVDQAPSMGRAGGSMIRVYDTIPSATRFDVGIVPDPVGNPDFMLTLFYGVGFDEVGRGPPMMAGGSPVDYPGGYYPGTIIPAPGATVGLRPACPSGMGCAPLARVTGLISPDRSITTAFLALQLPAGAMAPVVGAILCRDSDPPVGPYSACLFRAP